MPGCFSLLDQRKTTRRALLAGAAGLTAMPALSRSAFAQKGGLPAATSTDVDSGGAHQRLGDMLALLPQDVLLSPVDGGQHFDWIDYQGQFAALGVDDPYDESVEIVRYTMPLGSNDPLFMHAMNPDVEELLGFRLFDVHQVLTAGTPPETYAIYRGGVEFDALTELWESSGYAPVASDHGDYWSKAPDASVDLNDPLQRIVLARMNNMAIVDGTTLVCATTAPMIERVLELHATGGESVADSEMIAPLVDAMPPDTVNVMTFSGGTFSRAGVMPSNISAEAVKQLEQLFDESDEAVGPMPPLLSALTGVTAGVMGQSPDDGEDTDLGDVKAFMSFLTASEDDAAQAANTAFWRIDNMESLNNGAPYAELLDVTNDPAAAANGPIMTVELGPNGAMRGMWHRMMVTRDILPFAW